MGGSAVNFTCPVRSSGRRNDFEVLMERHDPNEFAVLQNWDKSVLLTSRLG